MATNIWTKYTGVHFAAPLHHKPEGPLDFSNVKLPNPFVVLIAGGSKGIGLGTARAFATAGAIDIIITARSKSDLESAAKTVREANPSTNVVFYTCDITDEYQVKTLAEEITSQFQRLDVLIINAGTGTSPIHRHSTGLKDWPATFAEQSYADYMRVMNLNLHAPFLLLHHFIPLLEAATAKAGAPAVIQLSSTAAFYVDPKVMAMSYSLSKFAVTRLIEHVHEAHHSSGINAFALQPGGVKTGLAVDSLPEGKGWEDRLIDDVQLAGAMCVWLVRERRDWLSGRYVDSRWDIDELVKKKQEITEKDLLKVRLAVE